MDSGFLYALYSPRNEPDRFKLARNYIDKLFANGESSKHRLLLLWPILYETLNSRFVRDKKVMLRFQNEFGHFKRNNQVDLIDDLPFREAGLSLLLNNKLNQPFSLVDIMIQMYVSQNKAGISGILTFDHRDFAEFCRKNDVEMLPYRIKRFSS